MIIRGCQTWDCNPDLDHPAMFRFPEGKGKFGGNKFYPVGKVVRPRCCLACYPAKDPEHDCQIYRLLDYVDRRAFCLLPADVCAVTSVPRCLPENLSGPFRGPFFCFDGVDQFANAV